MMWGLSVSPTETRVTGVATVTGNVTTANTVTAQIVGTITSSSIQSIGESFLVFSTHETV